MPLSQIWGGISVDFLRLDLFLINSLFIYIFISYVYFNICFLINSLLICIFISYVYFHIYFLINSLMIYIFISYVYFLIYFLTNSLLIYIFISYCLFQYLFLLNTSMQIDWCHFCSCITDIKWAELFRVIKTLTWQFFFVGGGQNSNPRVET